MKLAIELAAGRLIDQVPHFQVEENLVEFRGAQSRVLGDPVERKTGVAAQKFQNRSLAFTQIPFFGRC